MRIIKPKRLRPGDVIGVCAPSSPPTSTEKIEDGIAYIERCGFRVDVGKNVFHKQGYLAGSDKERAADLNKFFANKRVKAIFTARGGYGAHRILPLLDYNLIRKHPKILVGYSDITAIQFALLSKIGLVSFSGPMVAADMSQGLKGKSEDLFWQCLTTTQPPPILESDSTSRRFFIHKGTAVGRLLAGNLAVLTSLLGSEFFPILNDPILMLEEIGERPYRIDRMLQQIRLSGTLSKVAGVALGRFTECQPEKGKPSLTLEQILKATFLDFHHPIASGFQYGHVKGTLTIPQGIRVRLSARTGRIHFLEAAVR
jgi:muramoyltetrapeptide carboxypeptidase